MRIVLTTALWLGFGLPFDCPAQQAPAGAKTGSLKPLTSTGGVHDFDFEIGTWETRLSRLVSPLSGSSTWAEYRGTTVVRSVAQGQANLAELDVAGPAGRIEGVSLRLYNPQTKQWSLNFANLRNGTLTLPTIGRFASGRGEFYNADSLNGRPILVRFVISSITPTSCRFEQAFSADGGQTWEVNWIATDTRLPARKP